MYQGQNIGVQRVRIRSSFLPPGSRSSTPAVALRTSRSAARPAVTAARTAAGARREMFTAVCASCGKEARLPFKPTGDRPVYCSECFAKIKEAENG